MFRWWRKTGTDVKGSKIDFAPKLKITRNNGWVSLELLLNNDAKKAVWVEEAKVIITDLDAEWQTSDPTGQVRLEIRQNVSANEFLGLSLAETIYDAAGRPQRNYTCVAGLEIRCRIRRSK